ncbi:hypothetical protein CF394_07130 [Tetzosporium hominis]|uniref:Amidase domain-containing protein n=1 Tax=Tetzosporium hominis TaxID=2020506 RepID=A0A264W3P4_9BACL|nr:amidase [Tetzosporium hominis]OZS78228.1 hypothetical protein CF394_07130 [Tetzosporium hominis]
MDIETLTIVQANRLLKTKSISATELINSFLERNRLIEPEIKAWAYLQSAELLIKIAQKIDDNQKSIVSPLAAIPYGAKDIIYTNKIPTEAGSKTMKGFIPQTDATIISKLKEFNAILIGKTTTAEFASGGGAPVTRNPWNKAHTPGGSSTGSAAAISSGMSLFSIGTQTAGSIIRPAAYNGVTALKPSYGSISKAGIIPASWSVDTVGIFTKNVEDLTLVYNELNGKDKKDYTTWLHTKQYLSVNEKKTYTIGVIRDNFFETTNEIMSAFSQAMKVLEKLGHSCVECHMPANMEQANDAHGLIVDAETASYHRKTFEIQKNLMSEELKKDIESGLIYSADEYLNAQNVRWDYQQQLFSLLNEFDILITPATPETAPKGRTKTGSPKFNKPFSNAGVPVLTIPIGYSTVTELPIGIQFVANIASEQKLINIGLAFQEATDYHQKRPKI